MMHLCRGIDEVELIESVRTYLLFDYPLGNLPEGFKKLSCFLLRHLRHQGAEGKDNEAVVPRAVHKLFQVLKGGKQERTQNYILKV